MSEALVAMPSRSASYVPTLAAWHTPRSSQLTISTRSSSSNPRRDASEAIGLRLPVADGAALVGRSRQGHVVAAACGPQAAARYPRLALGIVEPGAVGDVGREGERCGVAGFDLVQVHEQPVLGPLDVGQQTVVAV